jgi:deoxyguanosine kinase
MAEQTAYIGLGSNLGDREEHIRKAISLLGEQQGVSVAAVSDIIETAALGGREQPDYLNAVARVETTLDAKRLYAELVSIEDSLGRERGEKWGPRSIDLDLLLCGAEVIRSEKITVPHSQMHLRSFVLKGLCQLAPETVHPILGERVRVLAERLNGGDFVIDAGRPQVISVAGVIGVGKTTLANKLSRMFGARILLEPYDQNPYMPEVYAGKKEKALDSQLFFLRGRGKQLGRDVLEAGGVVVSDYVFDKELIYAECTLDVGQMEAYQREYERVAGSIAEPMVVVYLRDTIEGCLGRIHKRNRPYEQGIEPQFLARLDEGYEKLFAEWRKCPVIRLSKSEFDCTREADVRRLAGQIRSYVAWKS